MAGLLPTAARVACLAIVVAGTWATAAERHRRAGGWWWLLALGAVLSVAGFAAAAVSEGAETAAGVVAIGGSALAIVGATIGFPPGR